MKGAGKASGKQEVASAARMDRRGYETDKTWRWLNRSTPQHRRHGGAGMSTRRPRDLGWREALKANG